MRSRWLAALLLAAPVAAQETEVVRERGEVPKVLSAEQARDVADRSLAWLVGAQNDDGSWGTGALDTTLEYGFSPETFYAWNMSANGIAVMALVHGDPTPERNEALLRAVDWLCTARISKRSSSGKASSCGMRSSWAAPKAR